MRLFINDNRISTAVKVKSGGLLQVYPVKKQFANEVDWQQHWAELTKPKIILRFGDGTERAVAPAPVVPKPKAVEPKAKLSDWTFTKSNNIRTTLPPGEYYIGDLCYVLGDNVYDNIFGGTGYEMGIYTEKSTGRTFLVGSTAYGDGEYPGSDGNKFAVDAGIIGICPKSLMAKDDGGGHMYTFTQPVNCRFSGGRFFFDSGYKHLVVDTSGDDDAY
jgi:hypothetical protein